MDMPKISTGLAGTALVALTMTAGLASAANSDGSTARAPTVGEPRIQLAANICGWYAIFQCARSPNALGGPGRTINTNNYPNFTPGWFCRVIGPDSKAATSNTLERGKVYNGGQGYMKSGC
jgi:hypothetical protein